MPNTYGHRAQIKKALDIAIAVLQGQPIPYPHPSLHIKAAEQLIKTREELLKQKVFR